MKLKNWKLIFGASLIGLSLILYCSHYLLFKDLHDIEFYFLFDIAFIPINVLIVAFIIDGLLNFHEKKQLLGKLNMVIGVFFSEVGTPLIKALNGWEKNRTARQDRLGFNPSWTDKQFSDALKWLRQCTCDLDCRNEDLENLRNFLIEKSSFLVSLLGNPNLLEHDAFTELLWAVFHLMEELRFRTKTKGLPPKDYDHLNGDMARAYSLLLVEWLTYLQHLKNSYPYLYSLGVRTNPFNPVASAEINGPSAKTMGVC
jgi:hypothetical protein